MTDKQKEAIRDAEFLLKREKYKETAEWLRETFPEAFEEPKPERESIDVRIEWDKIKDADCWIKQIKLLEGLIEGNSKPFLNVKVTELPAPEGKGGFAGYSFYGLDGKLHDNKVSPVPQVKLYDVADESDCKPELNGWTDELVSKFVDEWESYEDKRFANCMQDFKKKNNIE